MTGKVRKALVHGFACAVAAVALLGAGIAQADWKPTRNVEFVVPAGTGGGADQMARMIQGIIQKHGLMEQSIVVVNRSGGAGAEGFLDVKGSGGDPHKIIITLSNLFTTPLATGVPFNWKDLTPVTMLALDEFILWVNSAEPYQTAQDYVTAMRWSSKTQSGRSAPARHCATASIGLLTLELMWFPTSWAATSPPPL